jgi:hypothetical protein
MRAATVARIAAVEMIDATPAADAADVRRSGAPSATPSAMRANAASLERVRSSGINSVPLKMQRYAGCAQ